MTTNVTTSNPAFNPAQKYLFNRTYALLAGAPNQTSALQYANFPYVVNGIKLPASGLRVAFDIDKNMCGTPNNSKIEIYNLSIDTRNKIQEGWIIQLLAGYQGLMDTIFTGNIAVNGGMKTERKGPDVILSIECGDGESAIAQAVFDKNYPPGSSLGQILQDIAGAMSLNNITNDVGIGAGIAIGIPNITYGRGMVVHGPCNVTLDTLLTPQGLRWSVINGNLNIIPVQSTNGQAAIVVASGSIVDPSTGVAKFDIPKCTGMIGTPSKTGSTGIAKFTSLLNPKIVPGALVQLVCENTTVNGFYKILRAHFTGDSHENKWQVECECTPVPGGRKH